MPKDLIGRLHAALASYIYDSFVVVVVIDGEQDLALMNRIDSVFVDIFNSAVFLW